VVIMHNDEQKLIQAYIQGDQRAFIIVSNWILVVVKNNYWSLKDQWEDILQDVRTKLFINLKQKHFRKQSSLKTYVYKVAKYTCIDYLRKQYQVDSVNLDQIQLTDPKDPYESVVNSERQHIIRLIFLDLTEQCRKTLRLVFFEKQCYKRIGEMLGIAEGTVKSRVSRCLEKAIALRERFAE
jgi:RNA polymerase sigma-70 factor (ECF subfamily)